MPRRPRRQRGRERGPDHAPPRRFPAPHAPLSLPLLWLPPGPLLRPPSPPPKPKLPPPLLLLLLLLLLLPGAVSAKGAAPGLRLLRTGDAARRLARLRCASACFTASCVLDRTA